MNDNVDPKDVDPDDVDLDADHTDPHDQQLANLLSDLTDQVCRGESVDFDAVCLQNPDMADDLRRLWGAILVTDTAGAIANKSLSPDEYGLRGDSAVPWPSLHLPTIVGDYELIQEIGRGGMGVVFRATQISLNRDVAIKMILRGRLASDADLQRFLAEAAATAKLEHPNIVPVYDVGDVDGRPFFSMQYVEGMTLADLLSDGPIQPRQAAEIVAAIARAVEFAHQQGVLHRDLKPSNILIAQDGKPLITDFGLAKQVDTDDGLTRSGMLVGTPSYMSPEQASGRRGLVGPLSDVYSLGCVLYFALTGRPPFVAETSMDLVMLVIEQDPTPPRALRPRLDRDLEMIVIRCLQKPIDLRYDSAAALADDLDAYLADEKVAARSGHFGQVIARLFRETHHSGVIEKWGLLWMWHSLALLCACLLTWQLHALGVRERMVYIGVWTIGLGTWAAVFWRLRQRLGPVTFIERQIAHVWGASMIAIGSVFPLEWWLGLPVLLLSPLLGVISAMVFVIKAGMLSGVFYIQAFALLLCAIAMAVLPQWGHLIFGFVSAACFFIPGFQYARRSRRRAKG